jgi:hypothetical protein
VHTLVGVTTSALPRLYYTRTFTLATVAMPQGDKSLKPGATMGGSAVPEKGTYAKKVLPRRHGES